MREIKYRAWDKENQRFMDKDSFVVDPDGTVAEVWNLSELHGDISDEVELMQYTGLKDENGVEIYEGDVVSFYGWLDARAEVVYSDSEFTVNTSGWGSQLLSDYDVTVIGNKFQNPELLEVTE